MKLDDKFCQTFFYPFLVGVFLSTVIMTTFLGIFSNFYYDKRMLENIIDLELKYSKINIKSLTEILTANLLKFQSGLNEQLLYYQNIAKKVKDLDISNTEYNGENIKCIADEEAYMEIYFNGRQYNIYNHTAFWYINNREYKFRYIIDERAKKQIIAYDKIIQNVNSIFEGLSKNVSVFKYYIFFEDTELLISFPYSYEYDSDYDMVYFYFSDNPSWCTDDLGLIITRLKIKCKDYYQNIQKSKTSIYDNNNSDYKNRTIFLTDFYSQNEFGERGKYQIGPNIYTMCIQFFDPISNNNAYSCCEISEAHITSSFDYINNNMQGFFLISSVGFNKFFYYPRETEYSRTITENIFNKESDYFMEEKKYFINNIKKIFTSNYIKQIENNLYNEVYKNGKNSQGQYFYINKIKYKFSIFPVILDNLNGKKEHVLSIIYIYNKDILLTKLNLNNSSGTIKIILELILFIVFGSSLLYIIIITFNALSKHIVISIKNVNYMLKGINIGGEKRLYFLDYLKNRQDNALKQIEKMELIENNSHKNGNLNKEIDKNNDNINNNDNDNENIKKLNDNEIINDMNYIQKYDEESNFIEKEIQFYDYDDSLLGYRPLEIDIIFKSLIDLKNALILTSSDQPIKQIINYSKSENTFRKIKNQEGACICQSNIGNLQMQLLKFDKAIYHLALSLKDNKLEKFFNIKLNDELDEKDSLMDRIAVLLNTKKAKEITNKLMKKQQKFQTNSFSLKDIGILINTRYTKLIHAYYEFFKGIKKLKKLNNGEIDGLFMDTYYHSLFYYHKTIIQYIYLSYVKNDLIKIGESILDYLEFLIKFKFKSNTDKLDFLKIDNKDFPEYGHKQKLLKDVFNKIINWFDLFDSYLTYVKEYTSMGNYKNIVDDFSDNFSLEEEEGKFKSGCQSIFLFNINIQRGEFLKGKFALYCKNYNDALYYFIRSAKKKSIITDGLIRKKSLKNIGKILVKMKKKYEKYGLVKSSLKQKYDEYDKLKNNSIRKKSLNRNSIFYDSIKSTFNEEIYLIKDKINNDINENNAKEAKDIIILIDFNNYKNTENNDLNINSDKIEAYITETKTILDNYISLNDRFGLFIYINKYKILCPLMNKYKIDIQSVSEDLIYNKKVFFEENIDQFDEYDINFDSYYFGSSLFEIEEKDYNDNTGEIESSEQSRNSQIKINEIKGLIDTLNYLKSYYQMKEGAKTEKYIILFTDLFNADWITDDSIVNFFDKLKYNKGVILLLVGKNSKNTTNNNGNSEDKSILKLVVDKFGDKSEIIYFENMKKIKDILSLNNIINDNIIYPNEIYK